MHRTLAVHTIPTLEPLLAAVGRQCAQIRRFPGRQCGQFPAGSSRCCCGSSDCMCGRWASVDSSTSQAVAEAFKMWSPSAESAQSAQPSPGAPSARPLLWCPSYHKVPLCSSLHADRWHSIAYTFPRCCELLVSVQQHKFLFEFQLDTNPLLQNIRIPNL